MMSKMSIINDDTDHLEEEDFKEEIEISVHALSGVTSFRTMRVWVTLRKDP